MDIIKQYFADFKKLNNKCKLYLFFYMIQSISFGISFFIAIFLNEFLLIKPDTISLIVGFFIAGNLVGSKLISSFLDKNNPFKLSSAALFIQAICFYLITFTNVVSILVITMFILGASSYIYVICNDYLITNLSGDLESERATAISLLNVSSNIGLGIGGVIISYMSKNNPVLMFTFIGSTLLISSIVYYLDSKKFLYALKKELQEPSLTCFNQNFYRVSLLIIFLLGLIFAQQRVGYSLFLTNYFNESGASFIFLLNSILIIFFLPTVTRYAIETNQIITMGFGSCILGVGMFLLRYASHSFSLVVFICLITTLGEMLGTTLSQLICFQNASGHNKGKAMGNYKFLYSLGTIIGTLVGGKMQIYFNSNSVWIFCGIKSTDCILCFRRKSSSSWVLH
ncbi:multidrug resistance protein, MFS family [Legionella beliardensis]|uniref:Multidrug resistance protein, MFS family n=1 Tax=Legionella beliardensis TaxID=91822 RepID=A0A378JNX5_9GAMM|nr:MFS transporter [Legionella beliardensis]STX55463.1 multidrug resistance protein, MFS family [Legionella beliardensis]